MKVVGGEQDSVTVQSATSSHLSSHSSPLLCDDFLLQQVLFVWLTFPANIIDTDREASLITLLVTEC